MLKTFKDSYFSELHTCESLDSHDEITDEGGNVDEKKSTNNEVQNIEDYMAKINIWILKRVLL